MWNQVGVHLETEVSKPIGVRRHDKYRAGHSCQDLHLPYDDGKTFDDETTLVPAAEAPRFPACEDGRGRDWAGHGRIMTEARVGRLLAASLHQAIAEVVSDRLEYYEEWLHPDKLRDGSIGLAPLTAVMGFLRTEPEAAYNRVMARAGTLAAEWAILARPALARRVLVALPRRLRTRAAAHLAKRLVRDVQRPSRLAARVRRDHVRLDLPDSVFCAVRDRQTQPLCGFYVAAAAETMRRIGVPVVGRIDDCRALGARSCVMTMTLHGATAVDPALAA